MLPIPNTTYKDPPIKRLSLSNWLKGTVTAYDDGRMPIEGLKASGNIYLQQDGTPRPRPSTLKYGPQPAGKILGEVFEYKKVTGSTSQNWMISMQSFEVSRSPSSSQSPSSSVSSSPSSSASPSASVSASASRSPSTSNSPSESPSESVSPSASASGSPSSSESPSASASPSSSQSPSASVSASTSPSSSRSPSSSASRSLSPSSSRSPSSSQSPSASASGSPSSSYSPSASISASPSPPYAAHAQIFICKGEDASWTPVTGKYYNGTARAHFFQVGDKVVIMNGVDNLSYFNINTATVTPYTQLATPGAPTLTTNGVGAGAFNLYYRITANSSVGETAASNALSLTIDTDRDLWNGTTDFIKIAWSAVPNAVSYNVYLGVVAGQEYRIATDVAGLEYTDSGSAAIDYRNIFPDSDSTAGPRTTRGAVINGRPWMVGDADSPYSVWRGGDPGFELDFSPAHGGGSQFIGYGTKDIPVNVKSFRDGQGKSQITVLAQGTNGNGKRFLLTPDTYTYGSSVFSFWGVIEDNGQDGTDSPDAIITYGDDLHYPSRDGFKTTGTQPQLQNILSTRRTSNTIQDDLKLLTSSAMGGACGLGFEGRLYFSLPVSSDSNNEIWVLDLDRDGAWMKPWSLGADWMWLYNDNSGVTHFCLLIDNNIMEFSYSQLTQDNGVPFSTLGQSGEIYFSDDKRMWVQLLQVVIVLLRPQGKAINFQILGKTEDDAFAALGNPLTFVPVTFTPETQTTVEGWGEVNQGVTGWGQETWSGIGNVSNKTTLATQEVIIPVDEEVQWASYSWSTKEGGTDYAISDVIFEYIETGIKDLS